MTAPNVTHRPWCHPAQCSIVPGEPAIHRHLIGVVADVQVTVEQRVDPARTRSVNPVEVHIKADGRTGLSTEEVDQFVKLIGAASCFAAEVS